MLIEVYQNVFIGSEYDYEAKIKGKDDFIVIQACQNPYFIKAKALTKEKNDLFIYYENCIALNLADVKSKKDINKKMIDQVMSFFKISLKSGLKVMFHCNLGISRSASLAMLCLASFTDCFSTKDLDFTKQEFSLIYPPYCPSKGIDEFLKEYWHEYVN